MSDADALEPLLRDGTLRIVRDGGEPCDVKPHDIEERIVRWQEHYYREFWKLYGFEYAERYRTKRTPEPERRTLRVNGRCH